MSSKKLLEQCQKLEKLWTHVYTGTLNLTSITTEGQWYSKLTDLIDKQQTAPIWMSESKVRKPFFVGLLFFKKLQPFCLRCIRQPVEFCSDVFLLPLGVPHYDSIDLNTNSYVKYPDPCPGPPLPPKRFPPETKNYYDLLVDKLEFNNNQYVSNVLSRSVLAASQIKERDVLMSTSKKCAEIPRIPAPPPPPPLPATHVSKPTSLAPIFESTELENFV